MAFDFTLAKAQQVDQVDHYLIVRSSSDERPSSKKYFSCGDHLIFTLNGSKQIRLEISILGGTGKSTSLSTGIVGGGRVAYLTEEVFQQIIHANSIDFELQGSPIYSKVPELTGSFSRQNLENLKALR